MIAMTLQPHQQRVVTERDDLDWKLGNLLAFFKTPTFAQLIGAERALLKEQAEVMAEYSRILSKRIEGF